MSRSEDVWCPVGCVKKGYYAQGESMKRTYIRNSEKKFVAVGWYCPQCHHEFSENDLRKDSFSTIIEKYKK